MGTQKTGKSDLRPGHRAAGPDTTPLVVTSDVSEVVGTEGLTLPHTDCPPLPSDPDETKGNIPFPWYTLHSPTRLKSTRLNSTLH